MIKVFVYGTLMRGMRYHGRLRGKSFVGKAVLKGYGLYCVTRHYPGVVPRADGFVNGEVYEVDEANLQVLDELEDEGVLYGRQSAVCVLDDGSIHDVLIYCWLGVVEEENYLPGEATPWQPEF